jgi:hypothetical protein
MAIIYGSYANKNRKVHKSFIGFLIAAIFKALTLINNYDL